MDMRTAGPLGKSVLSRKSLALLLCLVGAMFLLAACGTRRSRAGPQDERSLWLGFGETVQAAGKARDHTALVEELSLYKIPEGREFAEKVLAHNPDVTLQEGFGDLTQSQAREAMTEDVNLFLNSYGDLFDGQLACVTPAQLDLLKGPELYSVIIWVEKGGKFHGVKVDRVWKEENRLKVVTWAFLDGYYLSLGEGAVTTKRALLEADTIEACTHPEEIQYKYEIRR